MINFIAYIAPKPASSKDKNPRHEREDNLYKDIFFQN